jgi:hypothetical protein
MSQSRSLLTESVTAASAITSHRFGNFSKVQAAAGDNVLGVAVSDGAADQYVPVEVRGTAVVEAGAAVSYGDLLESDADGRAIPESGSGNPQVAASPRARARCGDR